MYNVTLRCICRSLLPWISNKYYIFVCVCVCACMHIVLLIQHMHHIVTSFVVPQAPPYFSTLSHKRRDLQENVTENKMCVLTFFTTFVYNISHSKKNSVRYCH
jgi:hypothetical protein